jgi:homoserine dehydrogenase
MRIYRSFLFAPGNRPRFVEKVAHCGADAVILDLEDAVPIAEKADARHAVREALTAISNCPVYVRINPLVAATSFSQAIGEADLEAIVCSNLAGVILPKTERAAEARVTAADVYREGISEVSAADVASARDMGCVVKLLAICELREGPDGPAVSARVHPAMIPRSHPLASVREAFNAVFVESEAAGQLMFYGPGAGGAPTASAVLGDLVTVARNRIADVRGAGESAYADLDVLPMGETQTRYHVAIDVDDRTGVLARVAQTFAEHEVSIQTVRQEGHGDDAQLVVVSHRATDAALAATVDTLRGLDFVHDVSSVMRVEGDV